MSEAISASAGENIESRPLPRWLVYIIEATDGSLYTGVTTDLARRWRQHTSGRGAKYFRGRAPARFVYVEDAHTRRSAASREVAIKRLSRAAKLALVSAPGNRLAALTAQLAEELAAAPPDATEPATQK
ncbi:MAG: GIY-YIG nuclease family protein [Spongiibacteraceae bacterium]|nr:GIY-YIG nuclease family protein [Spongiibacteraceae bacterium]